MHFCNCDCLCCSWQHHSRQRLKLCESHLMISEFPLVLEIQVQGIEERGKQCLKVLAIRLIGSQCRSEGRGSLRNQSLFINLQLLGRRLRGYELLPDFC